MEQNPGISTRTIATRLGGNHSNSTVWQVLSEQLLYPYHVQRVQALLPRDFLPRLQFCQWYYQEVNNNRNFNKTILFTDEAGFRRDGIVNYHNTHVWSDENPHAFVQCRHQEQFSLNVWMGIVGNNLIGPFFLPLRLNGESYLEFLLQELPVLLEEVPLNIRNRITFMHDGAPPHFSRPVRTHLSNTFGENWIGRGGPINWPPRSPDLNPLDFYLWGHLKTMVYTTPIETIEELRNKIVNACEEIKNRPRILARVRRSMMRRVRRCTEMDGGHFQHLL